MHPINKWYKTFLNICFSQAYKDHLRMSSLFFLVITVWQVFLAVILVILKELYRCMCLLGSLRIGKGTDAPCRPVRDDGRGWIYEMKQWVECWKVVICKRLFLLTLLIYIWIKRTPVCKWRIIPEPALFIPNRSDTATWILLCSKSMKKVIMEKPEVVWVDVGEAKYRRLYVCRLSVSVSCRNSWREESLYTVDSLKCWNLF